MDPVNNSSLEQAEEKPVGYRRPEKNRKKKTMGRIALILSLLALLILLAAGAYGLIHLLEGTLPGSILTLAEVTVFAATALAVVSLFLAIVTFALKKQRKGAAIIAFLLALVVVGLCGFAFYAYQYLFGTLSHDEDFQALPQEELSMVEVDEGGQMVAPTQSGEVGITPEEIEQRNAGTEIEWEHLQDEDLPEEVQELIYSTPPVNPSYLLEGSEQISNFVLYGTDKVGSSDSVILLSVDRAHQKIKMISIPRDSYVLIPSWGTRAKLTYAYFWGGAQMAVSTLNYNFKLNVTDYIAVDTNQLAQIVDLVGGVEVDLDADEVRYLRNKQSGLTVGVNRLYGEAAVLYSRIRSSNRNDNEINRTGRQREVLTSLMTSVSQMPLADYPAFIRSCLGMCTTSFQMDELTDIALEVVQNDYTIESYALLDQIDYWGGILGEEQYFYCVFDTNRASDAIYQIIYEDLYVSGYPQQEEESPSEE